MRSTYAGIRVFPVSIFAALLLAAMHSLEPVRCLAAEQASDLKESETYERLLHDHVDASGLVDYSALNANRAGLDAFVVALGSVDPEVFQSWDRDAQLAFWINAYNAITLQRILDHFPITRSADPRAAAHPANSIRQIDGVWTKLTTRVIGREMTLDQIEHEVLRKEFDDPRIHAAIVCAADGCPPLRAEAFRAADVQRQLEDQGRRILGAMHRFRIDRERSVVYLSPILTWFSEDFVNRCGALGRIGNLNAKDSAALHFASQFVAPEDAEYILTASYRVVYLSYDWSLNEQP